MTTFGPSGPVPEGAKICDLPEGAKPHVTTTAPDVWSRMRELSDQENQNRHIPSKPPHVLSPEEEARLDALAEKGDSNAKATLLDAGTGPR
jgi:hypothetical protein